MPRLILMRHAKSDWVDPRLPDHFRPLNERGEKAATTIGRKLHEMGIVPDLILVSSARRTLETLHRLQPWTSQPEIRVMDSLYLARPTAMLDALREIDSADTVMMIGHNPGMHELAMYLAGQMDNTTPAALRRIYETYPTAALAIFTAESPWELLDSRRATLTDFIRPRDLTGQDE